MRRRQTSNVCRLCIIKIPTEWGRPGIEAMHSPSEKYSRLARLNSFSLPSQQAGKSDENREKLKEWLDFLPATAVESSEKQQLDDQRDRGDMDDLGSLSDYEFGKYLLH